jgi:hypothetical protein
MTSELYNGLKEQLLSITKRAVELEKPKQALSLLEDYISLQQSYIEIYDELPNQEQESLHRLLSFGRDQVQTRLDTLQAEAVLGECSPIDEGKYITGYKLGEGSGPQGYKEVYLIRDSPMADLNFFSLVKKYRGEEGFTLGSLVHNLTQLHGFRSMELVSDIYFNTPFMGRDLIKRNQISRNTIS